MTTASRLAERDVQARGRFGRAARAAWEADEHVADARTAMDTDGAVERYTAAYEVDPAAVAAAIVSRLAAGRTLPRLRPDDR